MNKCELFIFYLFFYIRFYIKFYIKKRFSLHKKVFCHILLLMFSTIYLFHNNKADFSKNVLSFCDNDNFYFLVRCTCLSFITSII